MTPAEPVAAIPTDAALIAASRGGDEPAAAELVRPPARARASLSCGETIEGAHAMNDDTRLHDDELREVAQRLGARAAERLDVERTAQAVVTRLRTEPRADVRVLGWIQPVWLRIAALLVLAAGAGVIARSLLHKPPEATALAAPARAELSELSPAPL